MLGGVRERVLKLACRRHHLRTDDARGVDQLPAALLDGYAAMIPADLKKSSLQGALAAAAEVLIEETRASHPELAQRVSGTLQEASSIAK